MREWYRGDPALPVVRGVVRKGDTVVDIGANWGFFTYHLARLVGRTGRVHAIEPDPTHLPSLRTIQRGQPQVTVHPVGLSDREDAAELHVPVLAGERLGALASLAIPAERAGIEHDHVPVRLTRLDALLPADVPVAFVKCDVEGHEPAVLRGAEAILRRRQPPLLIEIEQRHQEGDVRRTFEHLEALGYVGYYLRADGLRPLAEFDLARDQLAHLTGTFVPVVMPAGYVHDFLFVPPGRDVRALLAPP
jgi:FkbM family methyltransferase